MAIEPEIQDMVDQLAKRRALYKLAYEYYDGDQRLSFATDKFRNAFAKVFQAFACNICPTVVDAVADRLDIVGFGVEGATTADAASEDAWAIWTANRMDRRAGEVHLEALKSGDAYVIVWPDAQGQPILWPNAACDMNVHYSAEVPGVIDRAVKVWRDGRTWYLTIYYPDRLEKYQTDERYKDASKPPDKGNRWVERQVLGEAWPLANPYDRVPVFHFPNNAAIGGLGKSELADVIPLQDALNKSITDLLVAQEFSAFIQRWATGIEVKVNALTGKPDDTPFAMGVDRVVTVASPDANFGQFTTADLTQFVAVIDMFGLWVARVSGTPFHYMMLTTGNFPSGESMKTAEARFLAKLKDRMATFGNVWEDVLAFALAVSSSARRDVQLTADWTDPAPRSEKEHIEALATKRTMLQVPREQVWKEAGYTEAEILEMGRMVTGATAVTDILGTRLTTGPAQVGNDAALALAAGR